VAEREEPGREGEPRATPSGEHAPSPAGPDDRDTAPLTPTEPYAQPAPPPAAQPHPGPSAPDPPGALVPHQAPPAYPYQQQGPVYAAPVALKTNGLAIASLVLGILWLWWIGSILALVFGMVAKSQIDNSGGLQQGRGMAIAGIVLGWVGIGLLLVFVVGCGGCAALPLLSAGA
jgi:uncharacterized protein DUF4190